MIPGKGPLRKLAGVPGTLALYVIQQVVSYGQVVVGTKLLVQVVHKGILLREAAQLTRGAVGTICVPLRGDGAVHTGNIALVHEVHLGRHMPGWTELVVPGLVEHLKIVERVLAVVETVDAGVAVVVLRA